MGGSVLLRALTLVLGLILVGSACSQDVAIDPPRPADSATAPGAGAQAALDGLQRAIVSGTRQDAESLASPGSAESLGWVHDNAGTLGVTDLELRYVDEGPALSETERAEFGADAWRGTVDLSYAYRGFDQHPARIETEVVLVPEGDRVRLGPFGGPGVRTPLWLVDQLAVVRTERSLVAVAGSAAGRYPGLVTTAVREVQRVLESWRGSVVVEVPESGEQLEAALNATPGQYDNIAAVTTTADGALDPGAPVRILVNPTVFGKLRARGAQVVMTHETTHVALDAPFATMPTWLLEGFADYVALDRAGVPVSLAAGQILRRIRKDGLPDGLPTSEELSPTATGLGATYEEAWLACRFLAQQYGARKIIAFYGAVNAGSSAAEAFESVLGTTESQFVSDWRQDLARLAGVAG